MSFPSSAGAGGELSPGSHPVAAAQRPDLFGVQRLRERRLPGGYFPMRINRLLKRELRAKNLRYDGPLRPADEMAKHRPVPVKRLISKLGLDPGIRKRR